MFIQYIYIYIIHVEDCVEIMNLGLADVLYMSIFNDLMKPTYSNCDTCLVEDESIRLNGMNSNLYSLNC